MLCPLSYGGGDVGRGGRHPLKVAALPGATRLACPARREQEGLAVTAPHCPHGGLDDEQVWWAVRCIIQVDAREDGAAANVDEERSRSDPEPTACLDRFDIEPSTRNTCERSARHGRWVLVPGRPLRRSGPGAQGSVIRPPGPARS